MFNKTQFEAKVLAFHRDFPCSRSLIVIFTIDNKSKVNFGH